jgi:hypothetical protein
LSGTVDAQYLELRRILRQIYYKELGLAIPDAPPEVATDHPAQPTETATVAPVAGS